MDPHIDLVVTHDLGQNDVEFFTSYKKHQFGIRLRFYILSTKSLENEYHSQY